MGLDPHSVEPSGLISAQLAKNCGFARWPGISVSCKSYLELPGVRKEQLVYLTADSPNEIRALEPGGVYILGGIVDRNRYPGKCCLRPLKWLLFTVSARSVLTIVSACSADLQPGRGAGDRNGPFTTGWLATLARHVRVNSEPYDRHPALRYQVGSNTAGARARWLECQAVGGADSRRGADGASSGLAGGVARGATFSEGRCGHHQFTGWYRKAGSRNFDRNSSNRAPLQSLTLVTRV
jgi:hypothetical protein